MKLSTLKKQAQQAARYRGHRMQWGRVYGAACGPYGQNGKCRDCGAYVFVQEKSAPNGIGVSGLAVAVDCDQKGKR